MRSIQATLKHCISLISQAQEKQAFEILLAHYYFKTQHEVIQLSAQWHDWHKDKIHDTINSEDKRHNKIIEALLTYVNSIKTNTHNHFASNISRPADNILDAQNIPIGRAKDIEKLHEKLAQDNKIVCLRGIGGIGKTTIARGYCFTEMAANCFDSVYWINLDDNVNTQKPVQLALEQALILQLMQALELQGKTVMEQRDIIAAYFADNQNHKLLILDNANDKMDIEKNLAWLKSFQCAILLTSRATIQNIADIPIETLSEDDALQVFSCFYRSPFREKEARILLQTLQYHTLLIELCAKTLQNDADITISQLITAAQDNKLDILNTENIILRNDLYIAKPIKNFLLAIFAISELSAAERQVLMYFSLLLNKEYALETLKTWFIFPADFENPPKLSQILKKLYQKGWLHENIVLKEEATLHFYACHPLIRYAVFEQMKPNTDSVYMFLEAIQKDSNYNAYRNPIEQAEYIEELKNIIHIFQAENLIIANIYYSLEYLYRNIGNYHVALEYGKKNVSIIENINPENKNIIAMAYNEIAITYHYLNNNEKDLAYNLKAIAIREKILPENHIDLAFSYNNIAGAYHYLNNNEKALEYHLKAIFIKEKILPENHPSLALSYMWFAVIYERLNNNEKALNYHLKAITIQKNVLPENHPNLALSYNNIAATYKKIINYEKALDYNLKAITIYEKVLPENHPDLAISYWSVAGTYYDLSDYITAKDYIDKSVDIFKKVLPENHPDLKNSLSWQKTIYQALSENT